MQALIIKPWDYTLFKEGDSYYFEVLCGGSALFELKFEFSSSEKAEYETRGESYLEELAAEVKAEPNLYMSRKILPNHGSDQEHSH